MDTVGRTEAAVSAALARSRRRARLLEQAEDSGWGDVVAPTVFLAAAANAFFFDTMDASLTAAVVLTALGGLLWQQRRLRARVNALTRLLAEIGYPGEA
ncbi:MAG: hypothetical protein R2752_02310 [Vicinamibacterales bacterium]